MKRGQEDKQNQPWLQKGKPFPSKIKKREGDTSPCCRQEGRQVMTMDIEPTFLEFSFLGHSGQCSALINSDFVNYLNLRKIRKYYAKCNPKYSCAPCQLKSALEYSILTLLTTSLTELTACLEKANVQKSY